ncbi:MAG: tetratricopeptide repeat protein [Candidatus Poribacteria bacterium]|nr:tetratricopeptide repeat protein [Candidatus Poribacteria bacterium]
MQETLKKEKAFQEKLAKLKKMPDDVKLNREIAILYVQRHQIEKAEPIREVIPDDMDLNREFGIFYLSKNEMEKALKISEMMPDDVKLNYEFAVTYLEQGQIEKAFPYSQKVLDKDPENTTGLLPNLHLEIGATYASKIQSSLSNAEKYGKNAVKYLQTVIEKYPDSNDTFENALYCLGATYSDMGVRFSIGDFDKSIEAFEKLMNHTTEESKKEGIPYEIIKVKQSAAYRAALDYLGEPGNPIINDFETSIGVLEDRMNRHNTDERTRQAVQKEFKKIRQLTAEAEKLAAEAETSE